MGDRRLAMTMFARAAQALLLATALMLAPASRAAETIIAGGVSSASANLWPIFIGTKKGFFADADIKIDLVFSQSNSATIQQVVVNAINVSIGSGLVDPIRAIEKGAPLAIVRIEVQRPPYALIGRPGIKEMKDLKGRIVSVGGAKDITRIFLERMLITAGVDPKGVDLIFAGATSARYSALRSGAADAAMLTAPYNFDAMAAGFPNLGLTADYVDMPFSGVTINRNWAARNAGTVQRFLAVYTRSIHWLAAPENRKEAIDMMVSVSSLKAEDVEKAYDFLVTGGFFETTGRISKAKLGKVVDTLKELGDIPRGFAAERLFLPDVTELTE
jgi:ABC-type nitrate/sulfonate/bicarbonate transport system substrate-binding protein